MSIQEIAQKNVSKWRPEAAASDDVLAVLIQSTGFDLPIDYIDFLRFSNGGSGGLPVQPWCFDSLWRAEELVQYNREYGVAKYCPGFFAIGSSGGGEMFAFDMRGAQPWPVVVVPFVGMNAELSITVARDFQAFVEMFGKTRAAAAVKEKQ